MAKRLNVGLIGVGRMGHIHADTLAYHVSTARLAGIADINANLVAEMAERYECRKSYTDPIELINDVSIEAVLIATPHDTHSRLIVAAAEAGKPIFCEKPLDRDLMNCEVSLAAVDRAGVPLQIGFQRRYDPAHLHTRQLIAQGKLGRIVFIYSHTRDPELPPARVRAVAGGVFRSTCVHDFDVLRWLAADEIDELTAVSSAGPESGFTSSNEPDAVAINVKFRNGTLGHIEAIRGVGYGYDVRTEVVGTESTIIGGYHREIPVTEFSRDGVRHDHVFWFPQRFKQAYINELSAWTDNLIAGRPVTPSGVDGRQALILALSAEESIRRGGITVKVPTLGLPVQWL